MKHCSYRICTLYSGSSGNAALFEFPSARILVDAGKSARALVRALGEIGITDPASGGGARPLCDAIFLTHEHIDHTSALAVLTKKRAIPIHLTEGTLSSLSSKAPDTLLALLIPHPPLFTVTVGDVTVSSFPTSHDGKMSVGYRFTFPDTDGTLCSVGYATDLGIVTDAVKEGLLGCEAVVLESNHDCELLRYGPYPYDLKERIASKRGHLSNEDCTAFAKELAERGTRRFLLAHLSKENNLPCLAREVFLSAFPRGSVAVEVASPDRVTFLPEFEVTEC